MKKLFFIDDTLENKISYYHLAFFLISLPFDFFYSEVVLISFVIHTLIHLRKSRLHLLKNKPVLVLVSLYFLGIFSILYSNYKQEGFLLATSQLSFLLFPVLFTLNGIALEKYKLPLVKIFGITCMLVILFLFSDAIRTICYFHLPLSSLFSKEFINQNFSERMELHATYFSMYVAFSLFAFVYFFIKEKRFSKKILYGIFIFIFLAGLLQLSSRAVCVASVIISFIAFPFLLLASKKRIQFIIIALLISIGFFFIISHTDSFRQRFTGELKDDLTSPSITNSITEPRITRWKAEAELIKASPIIGYGNGSEREILKEKYFEKKLYQSYTLEFNAHSQYLSFLLNLGIIGLVLFLSILYYSFSIAIKSRDILFLSFLIIISVTCISEDALNYNKGIFFYSFFISLFLLTDKNIARKVK
jgi:O-antigen ligase